MARLKDGFEDELACAIKRAMRASVSKLETVWEPLLHTWKEQRLYLSFRLFLEEGDIDTAYEVCRQFETACPEQPQVIKAMFSCLEACERERGYHGSYVLLSKNEWKQIRNMEIRVKEDEITPWIKTGEVGWRIPVTVCTREEDELSWRTETIYGDENDEETICVEKDANGNHVIICDEVGIEKDYVLLAMPKPSVPSDFVFGTLRCFETCGKDDFDVTQVIIGVDLRENVCR